MIPLGGNPNSPEPRQNAIDCKEKTIELTLPRDELDAAELHERDRNLTFITRAQLWCRPSRHLQK